MAQKRFQEAADVADVILGVDPRNVHALLKKGTAAAEMLIVEFEQRYPTPAAIPPDLRGRYQLLVAQNQQTFAEAEGLGWTPPS